MNRFHLSILGFAFAILSVTEPAQSQIGVKTPDAPPPIEGPSLQQTLDWISNKSITAPAVIDPYDKNGKVKKDRNTYEFNGCEFKERLRNGDGTYTVVTSTEGSLLVLDANSVQVREAPYGGFRVSISTLGAKKLIHQHFRYVDGSWGDDYYDFISPSSYEVDDAESMLKAFKHAIKLCQAEAATKAAEKKAAKPKDLF